MPDSVLSSMTTPQLIEHVQRTSEATPLELELLGRLVGALDEIDALALDLRNLGPKQ